MIHVVEIPHQKPASAWSAVNEKEFIGVVNSVNERSCRTIFEMVSPRQLLDQSGETPESPDAREAYEWIFDLAEKHGWDTTLYRADYLCGEATYQVSPVNEFDACVAAIMDDLYEGRVYKTDDEAIAALNDDQIFSGHQGARAEEALRAQLICYNCLPEEESADNEDYRPRP